MPRWDFRCDACSLTQERSFKTFKESENCVCLMCGGPMCKLPCAPGTFVLKGPGFHKNDYSKTDK